VTSASTALAPEHLLDPAVIAEPYDFYCALREQAPVWRIPGTRIVVVSSYAAVTEALNRPEDFSSNLVALLYRKDDGTPGVQPFETGVQALATADPPAHTVHRGSVFPELVARRMAMLRPEIDEITLGQLDRAFRRTPVQAMDDIANAVPIRVVSRLIGFRNEDPDALLAAAFETTDMLAATEPLTVLLASMDVTATVVAWIADQLQRAVDGAEADGLLELIATAVTRDELDFMEGLAIVATLLSAGGESTTSLIGNALHLLATDADLQERVRADPALVKPFVEEVLRLESPFRHHLRHAPHETELQGVTVDAGSTLLMMWAAANRDAAEYERPDEVVLDRPAPRHHLGFGRGVHLCVGAPLARLEAEIVLTRFLERTSGFALDPADPPKRVPSLMVRRFSRLPLVVRRG
jgi:cytochrome P450